MPFGPSSAPGPPSDVGHTCQVCGNRFSRPQELKRHEVDVHDPSRQCPFCLYQWKRPDIIRAHLVDVHRDVLPAEILYQIRARRGKDLVEFLDTYEHLPGNVVPQAGGSSAPLFPAPTEETTELPILPHPLPDYDIAEASPTAFIATSRHSRQASRQPSEPRGSP
ncbi:hypothetical protein EDB84DRAFT_1097480 [Lactarius hengduanensis]|nr:hypothetical protein EDB84DRAFT_1097480 [Lactarius hengduanensis]